MMKQRTRAVDFTKFRRPVKNRTRLGDSVNFNSNSFNYLRLLAIWMGCVALDLLFGFRFELLWPLWLVCRHLYDVYCMQSFASNFHYGAFSIFFVCITFTSDLICYLFIPVQVLLFIASTYVWIQFVYQSTDRGLCMPSFLLWGTFVGFEYLIRCRFDHTTWYLTRGSWITAGMFSTSTDSIPVGSPSPDPSTRLDVYRPFAAHCLGYPLVTLGFQAKSYFESWRLKRRRLEVMKQNSFYNRLLADAVPVPFEGRFHLSSAKQQLALEHDQGEYEIEEEESLMGSQQMSALTASAAAASTTLPVTSVNNNVITTQPTFGFFGVPTAPNGLPNILSQSTNSPNNGLHQRKSRAIAVKSTTNGRSTQNGCCVPSSSVTKRNGRSSVTGGSAQRDIDHINENSNEYSKHRRNSASGFPLFRFPLLCWHAGRFLLSLLFTYVLWPVWEILAKNAFSSTRTNRFINGTSVKKDSDTTSNGSSWYAKQQQQDDLISVSGDGSHMADEDSDREELLSKDGKEGAPPPTGNKRRAKRTRGRTPAVAGDATPVNSTVTASTTTASTRSNGCSITSKPESTAPTYPSALIQYTCIAPAPPVVCNGSSNQNSTSNNHQTMNGTTNSNSNPAQLKKQPNENDEFYTKLRAERDEARKQVKQFEQDKGILEQALDGLRSELRQLRSSETALKAEIGLTHNQERAQRTELSQLRTKLGEAEQRAEQAGRQMDRLKQTINQQNKNQRQKNEQRSSAGTPTEHMKQTNAEMEQLRQQVHRLEKELHNAQGELKTRQQTVVKLEQKLKSAESLKMKDTSNGNVDVKSFQKQIADMQQVNARLEKTLLAENRLKVDLFRALNDSKTQIETLTNQLRSMEMERIQNGFEPSLKSDFMNAQLPSSLVASLANNGYGSSNSSSSTPPGISPTSGSPSSIVQQVKSAIIAPPSSRVLNNDNYDLDRLLRGNSQMSMFNQDAVFPASPVPLSNQFRFPTMYGNQSTGSRCTSPSSTELFSIMNGTNHNSGTFTNVNGPGGTSSVISSTSLNGISPSFH